MSDWESARIIPTSGISSAREAETRAASALLAVVAVVRHFSKALLDHLGAPRSLKATVESFIEVNFDWDGRRVRPDGVIRVTSGSQPPWTAIVEVKTGTNELNSDQINLYWDIARSHDYDAVLTISNQIAPRPGAHPTPGLKVRSNSRVQVHHYSWPFILTEAVRLKTHEGVEDKEQAWILGELIRYLEHSSSGALKFDDMGASWVSVREAVRHGSLGKRDDGLADVAMRWVQLLRYAALHLGADVGEDVQPVWTRRRDADPEERVTELGAQLADSGQLTGALRVPNTAGDIELLADLKTKQLVAALSVRAPADRGARARVTWLLKQLAEAPPHTAIEAWPQYARSAIAVETLATARDDRTLLSPDNSEAVRFRIVLRREMGIARKAGGKSLGFIDSVISLLDDFYVGVVQNITPWVPKAPQKQKPVRQDSNHRVVEPTSEPDPATEATNDNTVPHESDHPGLHDEEPSTPLGLGPMPSRERGEVETLDETSNEGRPYGREGP